MWVPENGAGRQEAAGTDAHERHITHAKPSTQKTGEAQSGTGDGTPVWQRLSKTTAPPGPFTGTHSVKLHPGHQHLKSVNVKAPLGSRTGQQTSGRTTLPLACLCLFL